MNEGTEVQSDEGTIGRFMRWLRRPPLRERVLDVLADAREPMLGREIAKRAGAGFVGPYPLLRRLEAEGLVASREAPEHSVQWLGWTGHGEALIMMRVYWLTQEGRRQRVPSAPGLAPETA